MAVVRIARDKKTISVDRRGDGKKVINWWLEGTSIQPDNECPKTHED